MERTMKHVVSGAALLAVVALVGCNKAKLNTDQEKASYAIGQQIGRSLKMQNADVAVNSLEAGLRDAIDGKDAKLKPEEMQAALQKMQEASMKKAQEAAEANLKKGDEWLANNGKQPGWTTTPSGLQIHIDSEGSGPTPKDTDIVKVHYTGTLTDGTKFDSSRDRNEPAEFPVNGVIPGWTEALKMMKQGTKAHLAIPAKLAYGPQGRPGIPPNSVLLFDVELLEVKAPPPAAKPGKPAKK